jgi:hypothetical protein
MSAWELVELRKKAEKYDRLVKRLGVLFLYIDGISDERDSVPILLEARKVLAECL